MPVPAIEHHLPDLYHFVRSLADAHRNQQLTAAVFEEKVRQFYTPDRMQHIEQVVPGWIQMASYSDGQTLIHVTSVLTALYLLPEYQAASPDQQRQMEWTVLFHDVAKQARQGSHDYVHAFRSAAVTMKALAGVGFASTDQFAEFVDDCVHLTHSAVRQDKTSGETIQDNRQLPPIIAGIETLYGPDSPARPVIMAVLLHLSLATDPDYPTLAPLSDAEIQRYIDATLYPILRAMLLVDTDGWNLFNPAEKQIKRQRTLAAFDRIQTLIV